MNKNIYVFTGSKKDFEEFIYERIAPDEDVTYFMELIKDYNANLRQQHAYMHGIIDVENLIVAADDYASVFEHVIQNFINIVTTNHDVSNTYLHNPPKRVLEAIKVSYSDKIQYFGTEYVDIDISKLREIAKAIDTKIIGQDSAKRNIISNMYKLCNQSHSKPIVLLLLGDSGIGKTETAKVISSTLGGNLLRIQFSMMQTTEGYNYIFGAEHSKSSFAKDLLARETNIVLIDEFDKVNPVFYNAFYQLFDEGMFQDTNYKVDVSRCILLCTSNFMTEKEVIDKIGMPVFSRFDGMIKYEYLSDDEKIRFLDEVYEDYIRNHSADERRIIEESDIYEWHKRNISRFKNMRIIRSRLEKAINDLLIEEIIYSKLDES